MEGEGTQFNVLKKKNKVKKHVKKGVVLCAQAET